MAEVDLGTAYIALASDLTDEIAVSSMSWASAKRGNVDVRARANGRTVAVSRPGVTRTAMVVLKIEDRDDLEWLEANIARLVLVRAERGQRLWGVYSTPDYAERVWPVLPIMVTLTVNEVTVSEVV